MQPKVMQWPQSIIVDALRNASPVRHLHGKRLSAGRRFPGIFHSRYWRGKPPALSWMSATTPSKAFAIGASLAVKMRPRDA